ncbi:hypothetical protein [Pseudomarimonas salicorniae]|uniref:Uncharacterized protein n=1 Tax=Pseudomarimonas salicorniae TaxID=2933270 RepID=A0ABT0GG04_9GAMM|nr:hypothetical protein [Lysobacter sp. CAU 1642]MCK7593470.1 hypothetical protein [Lysobacter sp. CAU 1642]
MPSHLSGEELQELLDHRSPRCVSLFLPTARSGEGVRQAPIHLKNLLAEADRHLQARGLKPHESEAALAPAVALIDDAPFWEHQREGLALFLNAEGLRSYSLPISFEPLAVVADAFEILPLLPLLALGDRFYILALSRNQVRLLEATHDSVVELEVPDMPRSQAEALAHDDREQSLQFHTGASGNGGARPAIFHGQGGSDDTEKLDLYRFFQQVDRALSRFLANEQAPMVLASVNYQQALYREANHYARLIEPGIDGNPDSLANETLRDRALPLVEPVFREAEREAKDRLAALADSKRAIDSIEKLVPAAYWGRVDTLFVERDQHVWGQFDPTANKVYLSDPDEVAPGDYDLLDLAVRRTLAKGGTVFALSGEHMPAGSPAAAIGRY